MLSFINFNSEVETKDQYYERMAKVVNAIRTGALYDGMDLHAIYTPHALHEVENCIMKIIYEDVIAVAYTLVAEHKIFYLKEDFGSELFLNVMVNFHKYNNPDYRVTDEDGNFVKISFGNFVRFCAKKCLRDLVRREVGNGEKVGCKIRKIEKTIEYIMKTTGASKNEITPEIIAVYMVDLEKNPLTALEIKKALWERGSLRTAAREDYNEKLNPDNYELEYTDDNIAQFLREWIEKQEAYKQMIFLQSCQFCPGVYCEMSLEDLACDDCYIKAVKMSPKAAKNIKPADEEVDSEHVSIHQISRHRGYTFESFKNYVTESGIPKDELENQVEKFFIKYWDELMEKILKEN